jgi:eukaryotic-like serine/threonine-protein kinase
VGTFLRELNRRHVVRATLAYVVAAFALLQGIELVAEPLGLPPAAFPFLVRLAAAGLVATIILAWIYEITPQGIRRTLPWGPAADPVADRGATSAAAGPAAAAAVPARQRDANGQADAARRLLVLPFRILRADSSLDYLAFALPDAIICSLAGIRSLAVRSTATAASFAPDADPATVGRASGVDVVLSGSLLASDAGLRLQAQLTTAADGTVVWAHQAAVDTDALFVVQEDLARRIAAALALPLTPRERQRLGRDVPATSRAYELYLRANHLSIQPNRWAEARDLYLGCLDDDPEFAPAWARLGRCYRVLGNYTSNDGERWFDLARDAFDRALALNPDLPMTHALYAQFEVVSGRPDEAMVRLLARIRIDGLQADTLAGLVHALRFCGLLEESAAAHHAARTHDPGIRTSVAHTWFMSGNFEAAASSADSADIGYIEGLSYAALGRREDALRMLRAETALDGPVADAYVASLRALLEGRRDDSIGVAHRLLETLRDAEGRYYLVRQLAYLGERDTALTQLRRVIDDGFYPVSTFLHDQWLATVREAPGFAAVLQHARRRHDAARATWIECDGDALLAVTANVSG